MSLRIFGVVCVVVGHSRDANSRRNLNGSVFSRCVRCSRELYRDPIKGKWRAATDQDRKPRGFAIATEESSLEIPKKRSSGSR